MAVRFCQFHVKNVVASLNQEQKFHKLQLMFKNCNFKHTSSWYDNKSTTSKEHNEWSEKNEKYEGSRRKRDDLHAGYNDRPINKRNKSMQKTSPTNDKSYIMKAVSQLISSLTLEDDRPNVAKIIAKGDLTSETTQVDLSAGRKPRKDRFQELYATLIAENFCRYLTVEEWENVVISPNDNTRLSHIWPIKIFEMIASKDESTGTFDLGISLYDYIKLKYPTTSPLVLETNLMKLLMNQNATDSVSRILQIYDDLCLKYDVFDSTTIGKIIPILSKTWRWKECFNLLQMMSVTSDIQTAQYSPIITAAVIDQDFRNAYDLLEQVHCKNSEPQDMVYSAFLKSSQSSKDLEEFFNCLREKQWFMSEDTAALYKTWFESLPNEQWQGTNVVIKKDPICPHCNNHLEKLIPLTSDEFSQIKSTFLQKSLLKQDIFLSTLPAELDAFRNFLDEHGPFDVVIDGLNTACGTVQKAGIKLKSNVLLNVIQHFAVKKRQKVLMLGKEVMEKWPQRTMQSIQDISQCFFTKNSSEDDLFMLYAALWSGPNTLIVTRDEFRDHRFLLGNRLAQKFKHWQLSHQVAFLGRYDNILHFQWPNTYHTRVQPTPNGWHIPYDDGNHRASYQVPNNWLCLQKIS